MGICIKVEAHCKCSKKDIHGIKMDAISEITNPNVNMMQVVFQCPQCHIQKSVSIKLTYIDYSKGVKFLGFFNVYNDDSRMVVLVCFKCKKLIGTRENYYNERHKINGKFIVVPVCESCHDNK